MTEWRTVSANQNYMVSDTGQVQRTVGGRGTRAGKCLKHAENKNGYFYVALYQNGKQNRLLVHRLVAFTFLGNPPSEKHQVTHKDRDFANNHVSNLRWTTRKEIGADKITRGTSTKGEKNHTAKLTESNVHEIKILLTEGHNQKYIADKFGVSPSTVSLINTNKVWSHLKKENENE